MTSHKHILPSFVWWTKLICSNVYSNKHHKQNPTHYYSWTTEQVESQWLPTRFPNNLTFELYRTYIIYMNAVTSYTDLFLCGHIGLLGETPVILLPNHHPQHLPIQSFLFFILLQLTSSFAAVINTIATRGCCWTRTVYKVVLNCFHSRLQQLLTHKLEVRKMTSKAWN